MDAAFWFSFKHGTGCQPKPFSRNRYNAGLTPAFPRHVAAQNTGSRQIWLYQPGLADTVDNLSRDLPTEMWVFFAQADRSLAGKPAQQLHQQKRIDNRDGRTFKPDMAQ